ncbi:hypothetical protein LCGC14_0564970 [marine sediment metagenome]|uniref:Uncharacterized protein n=1 Tax=marine sediment metagenome TaxID=412755 RepID=A0A0F9RR34_9ZZZZ
MPTYRKRSPPVEDSELLHENAVYVATGNTYPHRELFQSWAWYWDASRKAWIEDNGSLPDEVCIGVFRDIPGVIVSIDGKEGSLGPVL